MVVVVVGVVVVVVVVVGEVRSKTYIIKHSYPTILLSKHSIVEVTQTFNIVSMILVID